MRNIFKTYFMPNDAADTEADDPPRPFIEHFIELRDCLIRCATSWVLCVMAVIPLAPWIVMLLQTPLTDAGLTEQGIQVEGLSVDIGVSIMMRIMLWGGTIFSLPFLLYFIMRFVFPGLRRHERNLILFTLVTGVILFTVGVWMCFSFTLQVGLQVLMAFNAWMNVTVQILQIESYISIVLKTILAFGLAFQLPLILLVAGWIGLVSSETLRTKRNIAIVLIFVVAMVLTPPEPVSQIIMALPMCLLYEVCILLIRMKERLAGE